MTTPESTYVPISCNYHDLLETLATTHKPALIRYRGVEGGVQERTAAIADVFARNGVEYLVLSTGETVRLDRLLEVDGARLSDY